MDVHPIIRGLATRLDGSHEPVVRVIVEDVWESVVDGTLATGERLPTARQLAIGIGVSPRLVERAYDELERRGVIATRPGEGTFVSLSRPDGEEQRRHRQLSALCRQTVERAADLGFGVDELIDALADFRGAEREPSTRDGA